MDYRKKIPSLHDKFYEIPKKDKLVLNKKNKI